MPTSSSGLKQKWIESYVLRREASARTRRVGRPRFAAEERPRVTWGPAGPSRCLQGPQRSLRAVGEWEHVLAPVSLPSDNRIPKDSGTFLAGGRPRYQLRDRALDNILETGCNSWARDCAAEEIAPPRRHVAHPSSGLVLQRCNMSCTRYPISDMVSED